MNPRELHGHKNVSRELKHVFIYMFAVFYYVNKKWLSSTRR